MDELERASLQHHGREHPRDRPPHRRARPRRLRLELRQSRRRLAAASDEGEMVGSARQGRLHVQYSVRLFAAAPRRRWMHPAKCQFPRHEGTCGLCPFAGAEDRTLFLAGPDDLPEVRGKPRTRGAGRGDVVRLGIRLHQVRLLHVHAGVPLRDEGRRARGDRRGPRQAVCGARKGTARAAARHGVFRKRELARRAPLGGIRRGEHVAHVGGPQGQLGRTRQRRERGLQARAPLEAGVLVRPRHARRRIHGHWRRRAPCVEPHAERAVHAPDALVPFQRTSAARLPARQDGRLYDEPHLQSRGPFR